jgi:hypothetical protein
VSILKAKDFKSVFHLWASGRKSDIAAALADLLDKTHKDAEASDEM